MRRTLATLRKRPRVSGGGPVLLVGSGTSRHAAELAARWMRAGGVEARAEPATEALGRGGFRILVAVTQSGTTASILRLLDRFDGIHRIVVTNEPGSAAARRADTAWITAAGREEAIPATKSFTAALAALLMLARDLGADTPDPAAAPPLIRAGLDEEERIRSFLAPLPPRSSWFFLAGAALLPLASEAALKMMEIAGIPALALPAGELAHGPAALLSPQTPVVVLADPPPERALRAAAAAGAPVLPLASAEPAAFGAFRLTPVLQLLAWLEGVARDRDVDAPPGLRKSVVDD